MNIATFFLIYSIGKKIFGKSFWLGTPLLLLFPIPFWMCSTYVLTEPLYIFIHTVVLFLFLKFMRNPAPRLLDSILLGASIGAMILTRPTGLLFSFFIVLYATVRCINRKRHFIQLAIICCAIASTLLPWTLRNYFVLDDLTFLSSEGPVNLWLGSLKNDANWYNNPQFKAAVGDHYYISTVPQQKFMDFAFSNIKSNFPGYLMLGVRRIVFKWCRYSDFHVPIFFHLAQCTILILAAIGFSRHAREDIAQILLPVAAITIGMFFLHAESRFTWPVILIVLLFSGQGIRFLMGRFSMNPIRA
jgi:4-amino-4-deoxy-L-arabinose transferase-like glycosyltransferase